jgi:hypothetical protein
MPYYHHCKFYQSSRFAARNYYFLRNIMRAVLRSSSASAANTPKNKVMPSGHHTSSALCPPKQTPAPAANHCLRPLRPCYALTTNRPPAPLVSWPNQPQQVARLFAALFPSLSQATQHTGQNAAKPLIGAYLRLWQRRVQG